MPDTTVVLKAIITDFTAKMAVARGEMEKTEKAGSGHFQALGAGAGKALAGIAAGGVAIAAVSIKMAADFQSSMTQLVTGAGESEANIKMVSKGILALAPAVGESTTQLAQGMYMIESAGYHGAAGLTVLKAAAEGAKVGNADLGTVADAVTTALTDYRLPAQAAATVTSQLVATVASGKTHMQDLASSLAKVLPAASAAGVGLGQVLGAMATMTAQGTPAADAATYLRQTILNLENPTAKARTEMEGLGLSALDISKNLGERGLTGTFKILTDAIQTHMGPAGTVLIETLKKASGNTTAFQKVLANLPPAQQTVVAALADMVGGTKSMQAALELTGGSAATFNANVKTISGTTKEAGGHVKGWSDVQKDANQKFQEATARLQVLGIELGQKLIPVVEKVVGWVMQMVNWFSKHKQITQDLAIVLGVLAAALLVAAAAAFIMANALTLGIGLAVAALILGIIYLSTHWDQVWKDIVKFTRTHILEITAVLAFLGGPLGLMLAAAIFLAIHWKAVWDGIVTVIGKAGGGILTALRVIGDAFFTSVQAILGAASHLPFIGASFAKANKLVKDSHTTFDTDMTQWANDAYNLGNTIGLNHGKGVAAGMSAGTPRAVAAANNMTVRSIHAAQLGAATDGGGNAIGKSIADGTTIGIQSNQNRVVAAANAMISLSIAQMHKAAGASAVSKEAMKVGDALAVGVAEGILRKKADAINAAIALTRATTAALAGGGGGNAANQALGQQLAAARGWTGAEWVALNNVAMRESGWNDKAQNPTSSAYGIAQNIGGPSGYGAYGTSPSGQIAWMLNYIASRYGDPIGAWAHEQAFGWYDRGGLLPPGLSLAYNSTGRAEVVTPGDVGMTVNVYVAGSVVTEQGIVNAVHSGLLEKQRRVPLGIKAS